MTKRSLIKGVLTSLALTLVATGCLGGGDAGGDAKSISGTSAKDVEVPDQVDPKATALPGLVLSTNSVTWQKMLESPEGPGAVVLFIQPEGPSDKKGIARGDLLTAVDGTEIVNHEHAIAVLRSRPGQKRNLDIKKRNGDTESIEITARDPAGAILRQFLNPMIQLNPSDAVLRFLRAQSAGGSYEANLADVDAALKAEPEFVEALTLKSSLLWDHRLVDRKNYGKYAESALAGWKQSLDIDPENATALSVRSTAWSALRRQAQKGKDDAERTLEVDDSYPRGYFALAVAYRALNQAERALGPAAAAVELNPYNVQYWRTLARTFAIVKRKNDCIKTAAAITPFLEARNLGKEAKAIKDLCG